MKKDNIIDKISEQLTSAPLDVKELVKNVRLLYITQKKVLTEEEAMLYMNVSPSYWKNMRTQKLFPIYYTSSNKLYVKREDLEQFLLCPDRALSSALQIQQEAIAYCTSKRH